MTKQTPFKGVGVVVIVVLSFSYAACLLDSQIAIERADAFVPVTAKTSFSSSSFSSLSSPPSSSLVPSRKHGTSRRTIPPTRKTTLTTTTTTTALRVSELHIPGYRETKVPFILTEDDLTNDGGEAVGRGGSDAATPTPIRERSYSSADYTSLIPHGSGNLLHKTTHAVFDMDECASIVDEAERVASDMGWTTSRHGNYPTTDIPIVELPRTMRFLRRALAERIYPLLRTQFGTYLPDGTKLRVADGFVVKYDANGGQTELKPHRDGSVLSFNVALNYAHEYEGGGTWFASLGDAVKIDAGEMVSHASGILHGGHGITSGKRYIMVCFVILEGYDAWSMRFYNQVRNF